MSENTYKNSPFHIAFCIDERFFMPMGVTIASIIANNPDQHFTFHILSFNIPQEHINRAKQFEKNPHISIQFHPINLKEFSQFERYIAGSPYSLAIFVRLVIPMVLADYCDKVLYLDADMLCVDRLCDLIKFDVSDYIAAAVHDVDLVQQRQIKSLELKHGHYFNSGMMLINIPKWLDNKITTKALDVLNDKKWNFRFPDQDCLNIVLDGQIRYASYRWNYLYNISANIRANNKKLIYMKKAGIVHFAGSIKPWANWIEHDVVTLFKQHHALSPWKDIPLDKAPKTTKEIRMNAQFLLKQKKPLQSMKWYVKYLIAHRQKQLKQRRSITIPTQEKVYQ